MRPLSLTVDGLTCFREAQTIDFSGLDVVAIAGATGAGKSSLLDAMILALYGVVPRMGKLGVSELIAHGRTSLAITFDFKVGSDKYRVTRRVARQGRAGSAILSLLADGADGLTEQRKASGIEEVKKAIRELLGIDAGAFTQAVILPQGEFQQFLKAEPAARRRTLNALLGLGVYEDMRMRADGLAKKNKVLLEDLDRRLDGEWKEVTRLALVGLERDLEDARASLPERERALRAAEEAGRRVRAEAALTRELADIDARLAGLEAERARVEELDERRALAVRIAPILPRLDAVASAERASERARESVREREGAGERARGARAVRAEEVAGARAAATHVDAWRARIADIDRAGGDIERRATLRRLRANLSYSGPALAFDPASLERARALAPLGGQVERVRKTLAQEREALAKEQRAAATRRTSEAQAGDARRAAEVEESRQREAWHAAEHEHRAASLRAGLEVGAPCPVCTHEVAALPPTIVAPGLESARAEAERTRIAAEAARKAEQSARAKVEEAERQVDRINDRIEQHAGELAELEARLAEVPGDGLAELRLRVWQDGLEAAELRVLDERLAAFEGQDPLAMRKELDDRIRAAEARVRVSEAALAKADAEVAQSEALLEAARAAAESADAACSRAREAAAAALAETGLGPEAARALAMSNERIEAIEVEVRAHREQTLGGLQRRGVIIEQLGSARASDADVASADGELDGARRAYESATHTAVRLDERVVAMRAQLTLADDARARRESIKLAYDVHAKLAQNLKSDELQAFVLEEVLRDLVVGASTRLRALSGDRYGLVADEKSGFLVVDHENNAEKRSADTLSGGETFLASLALALELSAQIQAKAGKIHLESLFVDEGFGTLDPETLEVVADAILALGRGEHARMVGLITHVAELSNRMPHKIRVERGVAGAGSTVRVELGS